METTVIHTTYDDMEAAVLRNVLEDNGIECQVISEIAHSVFPFTHDHRLAKIRIIVNEQEAHRAKEIVTEFLDSPTPLFSEDDMMMDGEDEPEST